MNKGELVAAVAEEMGVSKAEADRAVKAVTGAVAGALSNGDKVQIPGFGNFEVKERAARTGRNPATGAEIQIAASKNVGFKAGKALKETL